MPIVKHEALNTSDVVYFELNNWFTGRDYPDEEPFIAWMSNDLKIKFRDEKWVKDNQLCVVWGFVDMSQNFCITAKRDWVLQNCPNLLTKYIKFLRYPDKDGIVYGNFDHEFLDYSSDNVGITEQQLEEE